MSFSPGTSIHRLRLRTTPTAEAVVIHCTGRLTSDYAENLRDEFMRVLPGARRIVLDLSDLRHMDSSGLGTLVRLYVTAKSAKCELELVNLNQRIKELLGLTNLLSVFSTCGHYLTRIP
ncbi:MAG: STAS domain-containing protein [Acidobacteriia bacterium]|nr:STAS domain-containing protein [Terriglobia bacterium]